MLGHGLVGHAGWCIFDPGASWGLAGGAGSLSDHSKIESEEPTRPGLTQTGASSTSDSGGLFFQSLLLESVYHA